MPPKSVRSAKLCFDLDFIKYSYLFLQTTKSFFKQKRPSTITQPFKKIGGKTLNL